MLSLKIKTGGNLMRHAIVCGGSNVGVRVVAH